MPGLVRYYNREHDDAYVYSLESLLREAGRLGQETRKKRLSEEDNAELMKDVRSKGRLTKADCNYDGETKELTKQEYRAGL